MRAAPQAQPRSGGDTQAAAAKGVEGGGGALPHLGTIQQAFGAHDVSGVRAHTGEAAREANAEIGAEAFATGTDVAFAGEPSLHTAAHEAAHVIQQRSGIQLEDGVGKAGDPHEQHADRVADAVVEGRSAEPILDEMVGKGAGGITGVQMKGTGPAGEGPNTVKGGAAVETDAKFKTYTEIGTGTVSALIAYTDAQADWSLKIANSGERDELRALVTWLRAADQRVSTLGTMNVGDVLKVKADLPALDAYARGRGTKTIPINPAAAPADARTLGVDILKLEGSAAPSVLQQIFTGKAFADLQSQKKVDVLATYISTCHPVMHAKGGAEIEAFLELAKTHDPSSFKDIKNVRNYHRFDAAGLLKLRTAQAGNSTKPFTLILHTAIDHNGAFFHDGELTAVLTASTNHTIMIEGAETIDAVSGELPNIVAKHGREELDPKDDKKTKKVRRIDQVMFAGHGNSHAIDLAGSVELDKKKKPVVDDDGDLSIIENDLNVTSKKKGPGTIKFMKEVMALMSQDPSTAHGRIVFNACLTASNEIDPDAIDAKATPEEQQKAMLEQIKKSPSIVQAMRDIAKDSGQKVDVRGGNGSFGRVGLIDSTGALDIVADGKDPNATGETRVLDPELTNPDKLKYVEKGVDPQGCLSAVAETWATDRVKSIDAVKRRRATPLGTDWEETVIQSLLEIVETRYSASGHGILVLAGVADGFKELEDEDDAGAGAIASLVADEDWGIMEKNLSAHAGWTGNPYVPVVFYQAWMRSNTAKQAKFLTAVGKMTVRAARTFLDMGKLRKSWTALVPTAAGGAPDPGQLRLALRDVIKLDGKEPQANTKAYLSSLVTANKFTVDIATPLDTLATEDQVLRTLGLHPSSGSVAKVVDVSKPLPKSNVDMNDDGKNESAVESMSATGRVTAESLKVREQPTTDGKRHVKLLAKNDQIHIMGRTAEWFLVDHEGTRGYAHSSYIEIL